MPSREEIHKIDSFVESMIDIERQHQIEMGKAFQDYEKVFNRLYEAIEEENNYLHIDNQDKLTKEVLTRENILKSWHNNLYRIEEDTLKQLEKFEERFQEYSTQGYDEIELIARYKKEAETIGKTPSSRDARESDHMPTAISYNNTFEKFANAKWRAGFQGHEKYGTELTLEQLKDEIHKQNKDKPIHEYDIPTAPEITESDTGPVSKTLRNNEDIGGYQEALEILGFQKLRELEKDEDKWKQ